MNYVFSIIFGCIIIGLRYYQVKVAKEYEKKINKNG